MNDPIKIANKQFYKYWKKICKEVCKRKVFMYHIYRTASSCSFKARKPMYEIIDMLLTDEDECISNENIGKKIGIQISEKERQAILFFSGYKYSTKLDYYINPEMSRRVLNVCDATATCVNSEVPLTLTDKIKKVKYNHYIYQSEKYSMKKDNLALDFNCTAYELEPANGERANRFNGTWQKLMGLALAFLFLVVFFMAIKVNFVDEGSSEAERSLWNAILGAAIPGVATIATTYWLINHEYKVDYHSERMGALPVLSITHVINKSGLIESGQWSKRKSNSERFYNTAEMDDLMDENVDIFKVKNKGRGMAFGVSHDRIDEIFTFGDIAQEEVFYVAMKKMDVLNYVMNFMDIYGNKYSQRFSIKNNNDFYEISSYPPELVLRTNLVRQYVMTSYLQFRGFTCIL